MAAIHGGAIVPGPRFEFGLTPPTGIRGLYDFPRSEFIPGLYRNLDVASQGFSSIWLNDHLESGEDFMTECWTMLTWLASRYPGVTVGTLVMCNMFRSPAVMAKMAATLQEFSEGRFVLGYGSGGPSMEYERVNYGLGAATNRERSEMLEEGIQIIKAMWTEPSPSFTGKHYTVQNAACVPRPDPVPPIMIGGVGERYTLPLVARRADWWNLAYNVLPQAPAKMDALRRICGQEGRDFDSIRKTISAIAFIDRDHGKAMEMDRQWREMGQPQIAGDPSAIRDRVEEFAELGYSFAMLSFPRFPETDELRLFMDEVIPYFS
jgi:alkanesulfonate monooxygenase SsuD/methylene tetrahydromethanopterin reductase-like flavin-dependent oxidoreductase (luciferase family)